LCFIGDRGIRRGHGRERREREKTTGGGNHRVGNLLQIKVAERGDYTTFRWKTHLMIWRARVG